jgi:hypothetical protein
MNHQTINYVISGAVVALVLFLRMRGMRRVRRLRLETLWVVPAIFLLVLAVSTWEYPPPTALGWLWLAIALAVGAGVGWQRGKLMRLSVDPATHTLNQQSSPAALLFIVALILARQGLRYEAAQYGINVFNITGILMAFALGLMSVARIEMYIRAKKLLEQARAA